MESFIKTIPESLSKSLCYDIIDIFNKDPFKYQGVCGSGVNLKVKKTIDTQIDNNERWKRIRKTLSKELSFQLKNYFKEIESMNPDLWKPCIENINYLRCETFQLQRYIKGEGIFNYHSDEKIDKMGDTYKSRIVTYLWYLNDVEEGGETIIFDNVKIKPEAGKLLLFPASWMFPHCGKMPISDDKYIITGWAYA